MIRLHFTLPSVRKPESKNGSRFVSVAKWAVILAESARELGMRIVTACYCVFTLR